jgi:hypothetical protein
MPQRTILILIVAAVLIAGTVAALYWPGPSVDDSTMERDPHAP